MSVLEEFTKLKKQVDSARQEHAACEREVEVATASVVSLLAEVKTKYGCDSLVEAQEKVTALEATISTGVGKIKQVLSEVIVNK